MALTRPQKIGLWIMVALALLLGGLSVWYFFFRDACDPNNKGYTKKGKISDKCFGKAEDPKTINTTINPPPVGCSWISDSTFPLKKCMSGNKIKALQTALGFTGTDVDGRFGNDTLSAVQEKFGGRSEVTQAEYEALINPPSTGGAANFSKLKQSLGSLAKNFSGGVYVTVAGQNKNYRFDFYADNGRFIFSQVGGSGYIEKGTYKNGGKEMIIDNGDTYEEGTVSGNMQAIVDEQGQ